MSLKDQAGSGVKWSALSQGVREVLQFITLALMLRLVAPGDFGMMTMASVLTGFVSVFKNLGTATLVIHRSELSEGFLATVFWLNVAMGALSTVTVWALAPVAALAYGEPSVTDVLLALSLAMFVSELGALQAALLERQLRFRALALIEVSAVVLGAVVGLGSALLEYGVWSLVFQALTIAVTTTVLLWAAARWRPRLIFEPFHIHSVAGYGLSLTGFNAFNYVARNADYALIGAYLGPRDLGFYTLAYQLMLRPVGTVSSLVIRVAFPVLARMQHDNRRFGRVYLDLCGAIALVTFPMMLGLWAVAGPFISTVFGETWRPAVPLLLILAPVGAAQSINTTVGLIYQAKGRTDIMFLWGIFSGIFITLAFVIGLRWGVIGVAGAYALAALIIIPLSVFPPMRLIDLHPRFLAKEMVRPGSAAAVMALCVLSLTSVVPDAWPGLLRLSTLVLAGIVIYGGATLLVNRQRFREMLVLLRQPLLSQ